ncbi:hypothetical protein VF21_03414 [Pseudogymnoascus sp. 05NY08]|nr:hypothetical protein VF21_03414 [Pseudogymnoascus sp. 05NY08]
MRISLAAAAALISATFVGTALAVYECPQNEPVLTPMCCFVSSDKPCIELSRPVHDLQSFIGYCAQYRCAALCCDTTRGDTDEYCESPR